MNRKERRKAGIKQPPPKMKHIPEQQYNMAINEAYRRGVEYGVDKSSNLSVYYMLCIAVLVLHQNFNMIRRKEPDGMSREEYFFKCCSKLFDKYNEGENTLEWLVNDVESETGFEISRMFGL